MSEPEMPYGIVTSLDPVQLAAENAQLKADLAQAQATLALYALEIHELIDKRAQARAREQRVRKEFKGLKVTNEQLGWALRELGPTGNNAEAYIKAAVEHFMVMRKHALEEAGT